MRELYVHDAITMNGENNATKTNGMIDVAALTTI